MKKVLFIVAAAALFFSCEKEIEPVNPAASGKGFTFTAGIENLATKADINSNNELVWASGDKIGVYVNDESWGEKNQPFTLEGDGGSTTGKFKWDYDEGNFTNENASFAFFPWQGSTTDDNNVSGENMYFKLRETYEPYTSGQMLTPLVANVTRSGDDYAPIEFKHAGAAVKLVINNLPAGAKSAGLLGAEGSSLWGTYSIPASVGEEPSSMTLVATEDKGDGVWLHFDAPAETMSEPFTFLFPVPEVAASKLTFKIYDKNDVLVWSRSTTLSVGLGRADVLNLPALDITPYKKFTEASEWGVCGTHNSWNSDTPMITDGTFSIAKGIVFEAGAQFKVRRNGAWGTDGVDNFPSSDYVVTDAGTYDVIFDAEKKTVKAVPTGECPYPDVNGWKTLGTGKFIDNMMWGLMNFVDYTAEEVGFVDVVVEQRIADKTQYRIANPYGQAAAYLSAIGQSQDSHSDYLTFTIGDDGAVTFDDFETGFLYESKNYTIKQSSVSTATDVLVIGSNTEPSVLQLNPDYYVEDSRYYQRNGAQNTVRIIFPSAVSTSEGAINLSGNAYFNNGLTYTNKASYMSFFVSSTSMFGYYASSRDSGYANSINVSTRSTFQSAASGTRTAANIGVTTSYFASSMPLYLYWYTYDSSRTVLMSGCRRFFYLASTDEETIRKTFTAATADEASTAGASTTPSFYFNDAYFSEPGSYYMTIEPSDDLTKGNIMVSDFSGVSGKAYGLYMSSKEFPIVLYFDEPFCTSNGTAFYLKEGYINENTAPSYYNRNGVARFKLNTTAYNVSTDLVCWGAYFGLRSNDGTWGMQIGYFMDLQ